MRFRRYPETTVDTTAENRVLALLNDAARILVLTGAGMSTESGIQDFRGPQGLWRTNPASQRIFDLQAYIEDPAVRLAAWEMRSSSPIRTAEPNPGHKALVDLADTGRDVLIATQNIDELHQRAGSESVLELHGTFWRSRCLDCGDHRSIDEAIARFESGDKDPHCYHCGGMLRTDTVAFGQQLDAQIVTSALTAAKNSDLTLAIGTSLAVFPAAGLCDVAVESGADLVIINGEPTNYDSQASAVLRGAIGEVLPRLISQVTNS